MRSSSASSAPAAVHWLRSRQELRELQYWLSLANYQRADRSFSNQAYLVYLVLFGAAWAFVMLTYLAGGVAPLLELLNQANPGAAAAGAAAGALGLWATWAGWQAARRSPVVFSEQDAHLLGQTPVSRRWVVLRWLPLAWLKSAAPFAMLAAVLGFAVAELSLPVGGLSGPVLEYAGYGLRALVGALPLHLAAFCAVWLVGVLRLPRDRKRELRWLVLTLAALFWAIFLAGFWPWLSQPAWGGASTPDYGSPRLAQPTGVSSWMPADDAYSQVRSIGENGWAAGADWPRLALQPLLAAYGEGDLILGLALGLALAGLFAGALGWAAGDFNLGRAAIETQEAEKIDAAARYGLGGLSGQLKEQQRLGTGRPPARLKAAPGSRALLWKDRLQRGRARRLANLGELLFLFATLFGLALVGDPNSRLLALGIAVINVGQMSAARLRSDLERWPVLRQLPFSTQDVLRRELQPALWRVAVLGWLALGLAFWLQGSWRLEWLALAPVLAAGAGSAAVFDVLRRSRADSLLAGGVPGLGAVGVLLGCGGVGAPLWLLSLWPGWLGFLLALAAGVGLAWLLFQFAVQSYRNIGVSG